MPNEEKRQNFIEFLRGKLDQKDCQVPKFKISFFLSSTFTDTKIERDEAMYSVVPELNKKYRHNGVAITLKDMRKGIKDANTLEHLTWIACIGQLKSCHEFSNAVFFIPLKGENTVIALYQRIFSNPL